MVVIGDHLFNLDRCVRVLLCSILERFLPGLAFTGGKVNLSPFVGLPNNLKPRGIKQVGIRSISLVAVAVLAALTSDPALYAAGLTPAGGCGGGALCSDLVANGGAKGYCQNVLNGPDISDCENFENEGCIEEESYDNPDPLYPNLCSFNYAIYAAISDYYLTAQPDLKLCGEGNPCNPATGNKFQSEPDIC